MDLSGFFADNFVAVRTIHLIGVVIGLGTATISDITFFRYLKDKRLDAKEIETLSLFSKIIWFGLTLIVLGGLGLFLSDTEQYLESSRFLAKMTVVGVVIFNGFLLHTLVSPNLKNIFKDIKVRKLAFMLGAVSASSWYSAFAFSTVMRLFSFTYIQFMLLYLAILCFAIFVSQVLAKRF
jgi:hypothetical protein